jgi:hypothetical protein
MASTRLTGGAYLRSTSMGTPVSWEWHAWVWVKVASYTDSPLWSIHNGGFGNSCTVRVTSGGAIEAAGESGGSELESTTIATGSDTGWICTSIDHQFGAGEIRVRWFRYGDTSVAGSVVIDTGTGGDFLDIGRNRGGSTVADASFRQYIFRPHGAILDDANLLTAAQALDTDPSGDEVHRLLLSDHTNAGDNLGTQPDWSVTGTPSSEASEPGAGGGGGGGGMEVIGGGTRDLLTGRLPHLRMAPKGFARRDRIYVPARLAA